MIEIITDANFEEKVLKSELPVLIDFYADWCGPCKMMAPVVDAVAEKYAGRLVAGKLNVDDNMQTAMALQVRSIPYMVLFKDGQVVGTMLGAGSQQSLEELVEKAM